MNSAYTIEDYDTFLSKIIEAKNFSDLSKDELLHILAILEGELDARKIVLKHFDKIKKKDTSANPHDALNRDNTYALKDSTKEKTREKALRAIYDNQLVHLERLIDTQKSSQKKQLERYSQLEKILSDVKAENQKLRDELEEYRNIQNKAESVIELRKMVDKLTLEVETQRFQKLRLEEEIQRVLTAANRERELSLKQRQAASVLVKEKRRLESLLDLLERDKLLRETELAQLKNHLKDVEFLNKRLNSDLGTVRRLSVNIKDNFVCSKSVDCSTREVSTNTFIPATSSLFVQTDSDSIQTNQRRLRNSFQSNPHSSSTVRRKLPTQPLKKSPPGNQTTNHRTLSNEKRIHQNTKKEVSNSQRSPNNNSPTLTPHSRVNGISPPADYSFHSDRIPIQNGESNNYEAQEIPVFLEWEGVSSPRSDVFPSRMRIGQIDLGPEDNWQMVEDLSMDVYLDWLEQIDSLLNPDLFHMDQSHYLGGEDNFNCDTSLGLNRDSVITVTLNGIQWEVGSLPAHSVNLPYSHVDSSPQSLSASLSNNQIIVQLRDLSCPGPGSLSSVVMQTMVPEYWWLHCISLLECDGGLVFVGRPFTCKTYLSLILIKLWENFLLESESEIQVRIHKCDPTLELSFDLLAWLVNKGLLSTSSSEASFSTSNLLPGYPIHHVLYIDNLQYVFNQQPLFVQLARILKSKNFPMTITVNNITYKCFHPITLISTWMGSDPPHSSSTLPVTWMTLHGSKEPLLGLIPRCVFRASTGSCISQSEDGGAVLEWISDIWIRLVNCFSKLKLLDALIGPAVLLSCPSLFDPWCNPSRQAIINWLVSLWNTSIVHHIRQCLDQSSLDDETPSCNNNKEQTHSDRSKVTESTLFVVIQQVLITGCPLSTQECEHLVHQLEGGSSVLFPWKRRKSKLSNSSTVSPRDSPINTSPRNSTVNFNNNVPGSRSRSPQLAGVQRASNQNTSNIMTNSNSSKIPVRIGTPPCHNTPHNQENLSPGRRCLPNPPSFRDES